MIYGAVNGLRIVSTTPHMKYRRGLNLDPSAWIVLRDTYSLLNHSQRFDRPPRIPLSEEPFLIVRELFSHRQLSARALLSQEGRKEFFYGWSADGEQGSGRYCESFHLLMFGLEGALHAREQHFRRHRKRG